MKIIVCTGDSHTVGQGADSIKTRYKPKSKAVYNTAGKGISRGGNLETGSYVNLLRKMVGCDYALTNGNAMRAQTGYPLVNDALHLKGAYDLPRGWKHHTFCLMETVKPARLGICIDGIQVREVELFTPIARYDEWSFRNIAVLCEEKQQVTLVPLEGDVYISHIQHDKGKYALINSGIGSCTTWRYLEEGWLYCVEEFRPSIVVVEAQTINDWIHYETPQLHGRCLNELLDRCKTIGAKPVFSTVAPICGCQESKKFGVPYADFIAEARKVGERKDLLFADSHAAFLEALSFIPEEERFDSFYVDNWHVNGLGHRIYADTIFEKLKEIL